MENKIDANSNICWRWNFKQFTSIPTPTLNLEKIISIYSHYIDPFKFGPYTDPFSVPQEIKEKFCVQLTFPQTENDNIELTLVDEETIDRDAISLRILKENYPDTSEDVLKILYKWFQVIQKSKIIS